jgi:hypothetical protein
VDAIEALADDARGVAEALDELAETQGARCLATRTCTGDAESRSASGRMVCREIRDDVVALARAPTHSEEPVGSAAGYGTPACRWIRTVRAIGSNSGKSEPVTAVQLSRGSERPNCCFRSHDAGPRPPRSRPVVFYTREFGFVESARCVHDWFVDHAAEAQPGRIRTRARPFTNGAGLPHEVLGITASCRPATSATCN